MRYDSRVIGIRNSVASSLIEQSVDVNDLFIDKIGSIMFEGCTILDIGTGNGFVLSEILRVSKDPCSLFGVDKSSDMVEAAHKNLGRAAVIMEADNNCLPFEGETFNIVTAKNVTQFSSSEVFRVLKPGGFFILREYGFGKGLLELANIFKDRLLRSRNPAYYTTLLVGSGFNMVSVEEFEVIRKYKDVECIIDIVQSFPFIENFSRSDELLIRETIGQGEVTVTSDPFIIVAQKSTKGGQLNEKSGTTV